MRSKLATVLITIFSAILMLSVGGASGIAAQGKGHGGGGDKHGGGPPQQQRQAPPQMQRQAPPQMQRQQPQMRPQAQRQMPQMQRPAPQMQRQQMPQMQRQMPQWNRQAQRQQQPQTQRQMPQWDRRAQRQVQQQQERPQFDRRLQRQQQAGVDRGRAARSIQQAEQRRPDVVRIPGNGRGDQRRSGSVDQQAAFQQQRGGNGRSARFDRQSGIQQRGDARIGQFGDQQAGVQQMNGQRGNWRDRGGRTDAGVISTQNGDFQTQNGGFQSFRNGGSRWQGRQTIDPSSVDISGFRDQYRAYRQQAIAEGRSFDDRDFRRNVYEYTQREAWRDDVLRSLINVNVGYPNDYYYIPPPQYPAYYGVNSEPWYYNVGYTYYDPNYSGFYVQPYYMAYQPYDYYYSSYYYDDPYYFDDPYDDYVTYRIFSSSSSGVGGFVTKLLGGLLAYGYDQGYRDGLMARQAGYGYSDYYADPYSYYYDQPAYTTTTYTATTTTYQPYLYSDFEDRHSLSQGYSLGYEDAFYGRNDYDPYYGEQNINIVSLYVGATFQIA